MDIFDENSKNLFEGLDSDREESDKTEIMFEKVEAKGENAKQGEEFSSPYERKLYSNSPVSLEKNNLEEENLSSPYERANPINEAYGAAQSTVSSTAHNNAANQAAVSNTADEDTSNGYVAARTAYENTVSQPDASTTAYVNTSQNTTTNQAYSYSGFTEPQARPVSQPQYAGSNIPHCCDNTGIKGQSRTTYYVSSDAVAAGYGMPYGSYADYTGGNASRGVPKKPMSNGLKSLIAVMVTMMVLFVCGFTVEAVRCYNEYGPFGMKGNSDWMDSILGGSDDYPFGFNYGSDNEYDSEKDSDKFSDSEKDTDDKKTGIIDAPSDDNIIKSDADLLMAADQPSDIDSAEYNAKKAYKTISESVVSIVTYEKDSGIDGEPFGEGTGIIVTEDGYVVTNSHVISDTKSVAVEVITYDGQSYIAAIVGFDARTDLAVLKINATGLKKCEFVNSDQIEVGQDALAVGNPGGIEYSNSLTRGAVSAVNRTVSSNAMVTYIQTDAAINPGNSGGPLMNIAGQVMGINTIKIIDTEYEGMGFAIPTNTVLKIVNDLITKGYVTGRVRLGISGQPVSPYISAYYDVPQGITINSFTDDSPFNGTDAKVDDIITAIDGDDVTDFTDLYALLEKYNPGDEITVSLYRPGSQNFGKGKEFSVKIILVSDEGQTQRVN